VEVIKAKCDKCYYDLINKEFAINPIGWKDKRESILESLPEVWCVLGDDDYDTRVCLDCLGLQLKESDGHR